VVSDLLAGNGLCKEFPNGTHHPICNIYYTRIGYKSQEMLLAYLVKSLYIIAEVMCKIDRNKKARKAGF
jgi:hypothetical protein